MCKGHVAFLTHPETSHKSAARRPVVTTVQFTEKGQSSKHVVVTRLDITKNISMPSLPGFEGGKSHRLAPMNKL